MSGMPISVCYENDTLYINTNLTLNEITLVVTNLETGAHQEFSIGTVEGVVSLPISLPEGTYQLDLMNSIVVSSVIITVEMKL